MKILFLGDSITDAFRKPGEINPAHQLGNGYAFLVASRLAFEHPEARFEFFNCGVSGHRLVDLLAVAERETEILRPEVVSILIGVNDVISAMKNVVPLNPEEFEANYCRVMNVMRGHAVERVVIMEPFLLGAGEVNEAWMPPLKSVQNIVRRIVAEFQTLFIPLQEIFEGVLKMAPAPYWAYDGIHPTHAGFELIARAWLQYVNSPFKSGGPPSFIPC
jgi:lysophospholipase L1-like esterase